MSIGVVLVLFFVSIIVCVLAVAGAGASPQQMESLKGLLGMLPYGIGCLFGLWVFGWFASAFTRPVSIPMPEELQKSPYDSGDKFDPDNVVTGYTPDTFVATTKKGRKFIIAFDRRGLAAYQEIDNRGREIGRPVIANPDAARYGRSPMQDLAEHLKNKVERTSDRGD